MRRCKANRPASLDMTSSACFTTLPTPNCASSLRSCSRNSSRVCGSRFSRLSFQQLRVLCGLAPPPQLFIDRKLHQRALQNVSHAPS